MCGERAGETWGSPPDRYSPRSASRLLCSSEKKSGVEAAAIKEIVRILTVMPKKVASQDFGSRLSTAALGRAITCAAISLPKPSTFCLPESTAAFTAATSPLMTTVM